MTTRGGVDAWFFVGLASSFPDITESGRRSLLEDVACKQRGSIPGCKVYHVPKTDSSEAHAIEADVMIASDGTVLEEQVLVFQYKGKIHAIDNRCPHSSFPLSRGIPFDIEDFGVALSAGVMCPKHGWSFDLFSGRADRGNYMLRRWDVQFRPSDGVLARREEGDVVEADVEVWIRRRQRV
ncbi:hypothetical protein F4778DRAFT_752020, partial [Xylariomycetidae sp. FL2044]